MKKFRTKIPDLGTFLYGIHCFLGFYTKLESYESVATLENKKDLAWTLAHKPQSYSIRGA